MCLLEVNSHFASLVLETETLVAMDHPVNVTPFQANVLSELTYFQMHKYRAFFEAMIPSSFLPSKL